jgi:NADH:ubiquinone oxidoreductase subunit F (NADH-binding)
MCRAEYPLAVSPLERRHCATRGGAACSATTSAARDFNFDIEIRLGAGAFVCGEETALAGSRSRAGAEHPSRGRRIRR